MLRPVLISLAVIAAAPIASAQSWVTEPVYDRVAPQLPAEMKHPAILVLSKANAFVHASMPVTAQTVKDIAMAHGWTVYETSNAAVFNPEQLQAFDVIVLNNTTGDLFTAEQKAAFVAWIEQGGRVVALHGAGGTNPSPWRWYTDNIIGAGFVSHPQIQTATVHVIDPAHVAMRGLPEAWPHNDECYTFDRNPRGPDTHVLATVDETTYDPGEQRMGADHPVI